VDVEVETRASSTVVWASGVDVSILSTVETLSVVVAGVSEHEGSETWHDVGLARVVVKLAVEVVLDLMGSVLKHTTSVGGVGVAVVVNPCVMLRVIVGAKGDLLITNCFEGAKGVQVALNGLGDYNLCHCPHFEWQWQCHL
jgi:hypothetical protein